MAACPPNLAQSAPGTGGARQVITVVAPTAKATAGTLRRWQRVGPCLEPAGPPVPAELGVGGISAHKVEGDGTTPAGTYRIGPVIYGALPVPGLHLRFHHLTCGDWWDEDPRSPAYNRFVHLPCGARPGFGAGSEALWEELPAYDDFAVVEYDTDPVVPGRGSAIFLHVSTGNPTAGCVAIPFPLLRATLSWLAPADHPVVVIGTAASWR